jgi:hypothetical protein
MIENFIKSQKDLNLPMVLTGRASHIGLSVIESNYIDSPCHKSQRQYKLMEYDPDLFQIFCNHVWIKLPRPAI